MTMMTEEERKQEKKRIRDRNYRFNKLSPAKKRVRIAKDVLEHLDAGTITPATGRYLEPKSDSAREADDIVFKVNAAEKWGGEWKAKVTQADREKLGLGLHEFLGGNCRVCGIGACFVAGIRRLDNLTLKDLTTPRNHWGLNFDSAMRQYLGKWFSQKQLAMIEAAFEISDRLCDRAELSSNDPDIRRSVTWGQRFGWSRQENQEERLRGIMQNIIENDGEFNP